MWVTVMGRVVEAMMEHEEMVEWIEENIGEDAGEEGSAEWEKAVQEYHDYHERRELHDMEDYYRSEYEWYLNSKSPHGTFLKEVRNIKNLLNVETDSEAYFSLLVMSHAHTVASLEAYLASTFIQTVTNSDLFIRKLVESDPVFSKTKFTLKEVYEKHENIKVTVAMHLKDVIFHKVDKVKPMFKDVLGIDFGNIEWLAKAVSLRHHCVHRAGIDKDGERINLSADSINYLITDCQVLTHNIEEELLFLDDGSF